MIVPCGVSTSIGSAKSFSLHLSICFAILLHSLSADHFLLLSSLLRNRFTPAQKVDMTLSSPSSLSPFLPSGGAMRIALRKLSKT